MFRVLCILFRIFKIFIVFWLDHWFDKASLSNLTCVDFMVFLSNFPGIPDVFFPFIILLVSVIRLWAQIPIALYFIQAVWCRITSIELFDWRLTLLLNFAINIGFWCAFFYAFDAVVKALLPTALDFANWTALVALELLFILLFWFLKGFHFMAHIIITNREWII